MGKARVGDTSILISRSGSQVTRNLILCYMENKKDYVTPQVEIILVEVERGFEISGNGEDGYESDL